MYGKAIEFAELVKAKLTLPSEPHRPRNIFAKTDVSKTWDRFRTTPEPQKCRRVK